MIQSRMSRTGSKLRSLLARVLRRCGLDAPRSKRHHARTRRRDFAGLQPLEGRQLLSAAIEMVITSAPSAYIYNSGTNTINASAGDTFTFDVYVTDDTVSDTLDGYVLNFMGTDAGVSLNGWVRNDVLFPDTDGDQYGVYDDIITDDLSVSGYTIFAAGPTPRTNDEMITDSGVTGWYLGSLSITLSNILGDYTLTLATSSEEVTNPTRVTQTLDPFAEVTPTFTDLNFHLSAAPTVVIESLPALSGDVASDGEFHSIPIITTNVDPLSFDLHDLQLTLTGGSTIIGGDNTISGTEWDAYSGVAIGHTGDNYYLTGLESILVLNDGEYVLSVVPSGVTNTDGLPVTDNVNSTLLQTFTIDTTPPDITYNNAASFTTSDSKPLLSGTVTDLHGIETFSVVITHADDSANFPPQTFTLAINGGITIDDNGNWTLDTTKYTMLEGGNYEIEVKAKDAVGNETTGYSYTMTITDTYEDGVGDNAFNAINNPELTGPRQNNLSIHEAADVDWRKFKLTDPANIRILANVVSGGDLQIELFRADGATQIGDTLYTNATTGVLDIILDQVTYSLTAGDYFLKITGVDTANSNAPAAVYNYSFAAGDEQALTNIVTGTVFLDENFDGVYNAGDGDSSDLTVWNSGAGVDVQLFDTTNLVTPIQTITTTDGTYTFNNVVSGDYIVKIVLPDGTFQTTDATTVFTVQGAEEHSETFGLRDVEVADRNLFYNNSGYDGDNVAAQAADDAAIASDKTALLPGQTATFANYSNYRMGVNGVMIDVIGLTNPAGITAADFSFVVGNNATPSSWTTNPTPLEVTVREGEGVNGSDRVTIIFADQSITNQWLQVTLLANANTGLAVDDVFYFGNAVGETGNSTGSSANADTNIFDVSGTWSHLHGYTGDVTDHYDFNRDGSVNIFDVSAVWSNLRSSTAALQLITAPQNLVLLSTPPASMAPDRAITAIEQLALALASTGSSSSLTIQPSAANNAGSPAEDQVNRVGLLLVSAN